MIAYTLYKVFLLEDDPSIRLFAAMILRSICELPMNDGKAFKPPDRQAIYYAAIALEIAAAGDVHNSDFLANKISQNSYDFNKRVIAWATE